MKVKCPWCHEEVELDRRGCCPECKNEVGQEHIAEQMEGEEAGAQERAYTLEHSGDAIGFIESRFSCLKCGGESCEAREVAMTGTGLSKLFDIQHNHYIFATCINCGFVEVYDPNRMTGRKQGTGGTALDMFFG
ncbi:zinc ribbon domain-containing protein [Paenibacillus sp. NPDC058071]|uniref:zinc ribbon domain-containing protein n=1 Tax=Paenibacillus sp. NPDC058071 TaxID=3346326 RepID=UPI0036DBCE84